ncbi:MAG: hypothetical protein V2J55_07670 [Candidatus Competibacteraceae bacterium]|jgi:hypothetical protein|nr:hypothetical protein [Candidatus Competibacteraceae bacterium]
MKLTSLEELMITEMGMPQITGQVFLQLQQEDRPDGRRLVALFGIIAVPNSVEVNKQYDLGGIVRGTDDVTLALGNPHEWQDVHGEGYQGKGVSGMLKSAAWRV